jgi:leucyl aminopeptidase (aminopeptidase T)
VSTELKSAASSILASSLALKEGEKFLVVTDPDRRRIGEALFEAGAELGAEAALAVMLPREANGEEPPEHVAAAMAAADVVVVPTTHSLTHTRARLQAVERGARVATMPGITEDMFREGAITADYAEVERLTKQVAAALDSAREALVVTGSHRLRMSVEGRNAVASTGVHREPGRSGNLPSGEAFLAPVEGTSEGELLVDGSIAGVGRLSESVLLKISEGMLASASGQEGERLLDLLDGFPKGRSVAELGVGTNDRARLTGVTLEDEKIYGTNHIAFGSNDTFGGTVAAGVHLDAVVLEPELYLDDRLVVGQGLVHI